MTRDDKGGVGVWNGPKKDDVIYEQPLTPTLLSQVLGLGTLLITVLVCVGTLIFLFIEQSKQISSLQNSLYEICINSLAEHLQANPLILFIMCGHLLS